MMNFNGTKTKKIAAIIIAIILVLAMIIPLCVSFM